MASVPSQKGQFEKVYLCSDPFQNVVTHQKSEPVTGTFCGRTLMVAFAIKDCVAGSRAARFAAAG